MGRDHSRCNLSKKIYNISKKIADFWVVIILNVICEQKKAVHSERNYLYALRARLSGEGRRSKVYTASALIRPYAASQLIGTLHFARGFKKGFRTHSLLHYAILLLIQTLRFTRGVKNSATYQLRF